MADILFTTGTTGDPKGVVLTHKNINSAVKNINAFIGNTSEDSEVIPLPLSHSFGLGRMRCNLKSGGTLILVDGFTFVGIIFKALDEHGIKLPKSWETSIYEQTAKVSINARNKKP